MSVHRLPIGFRGRTLLAAALAAATVAPLAQADGTSPSAFDLLPAAHDTLWKTENGGLEAAQDGAGVVYRWRPEPGQTAELAIREDHPLLERLRLYDQIAFEFRIVSGEVGEISLQLLGHVSGPRQYKVHEWHVGILTTPRKAWLHRCFELARPDWFPWDNPDGQAEGALLRLTALALVPDTVVELRSLALTRGRIRLKPDFEPPVTWPVVSRADDGSAVVSLTHHVLNQANRPLDIVAEVASAHDRFAVTIDPPRVENVKNGKTAVFTVRAVISPAAEAAAPELAAEPLRLAFRPADDPAAAVWWQGDLVRPLSPAVRSQAVIAPDDLALIRDKLPTDEVLGTLLGSAVVIREADRFLEKELVRIPTGHAHVRNNWLGDWRPADRMPEIIDVKTGEKQFDTASAAITWKEYLSHTGRALDHLADAYLFTGDEKYARKAIELFELYARQYADLEWGNMFEPAWSDGPAILSSSRAALTSTYGSNWYFKGHCRLLSAIADSPSWTDEARRRVYLGFVLPYATELMKFHGGISNMTDITNHNVLLLGLAFGDAGLVRWALKSDPGLLRRLEDISPDGFSSEGRPLNYHHAAMSEYLPALAYLGNSNIAVELPAERLLAAIRMPFQRATLAGFVPATGDSGRGMKVGKRSEADWLIGLFPKEDWLFDLGTLSSPAARLAAYRSGRRPSPDAWQGLIETEPRLFADTGYAILRTGRSVAEQVMVTLDFGRNPMHAHLDRNTISLSAFGHLYSQGPGSLYNIGRGGITRNEDLDRTVSAGSLSQNVILVDGRNQLPAVGAALRWLPDGPRQAVVGRVPGIRPGVDHIRGVILEDGIVAIVDRVASDAEHAYDFVYHNVGELHPGAGWRTEPVDEPLGRTDNYEHLVEPRKLIGGGPIRLDWKVAEGANLSLWQLPGGQPYVAVTGLNNIQTGIMPQPAPTLVHRRRGRTIHFLTVLEPWRERARVIGVEPRGEAGMIVQLAGGGRLVIDLDELLGTR